MNYHLLSRDIQESFLLLLILKTLNDPLGNYRYKL